MAEELHGTALLGVNNEHELIQSFRALVHLYISKEIERSVAHFSLRCLQVNPLSFCIFQLEPQGFIVCALSSIRF